MTKKQTENKILKRAPVVAIMGHIDHGKSTLLDYIRNTNITAKEAGGITQRLSAYEAIQKDENGKDRKITFLDTPGHEAFSTMRERGAKAADIAILIVSAEDGVKPQTVEAWKTISKSKVPCIVAINKIDKPGANVEKTKMSLAENEIFLENFGGNIPFTEISAKTGQGVDNLLSLINIVADMEDFKGNKEENASGFVLEANLDPKRGIQATLVIKDGTLKKGMTVVVEDSICPVRMIENFKGEQVNEISFSSPVRLAGFDKIPQAGAEFLSFVKKEEAVEYAKDTKKYIRYAEQENTQNEQNDDKIIFPLFIKADVTGSLEAIAKEIEKIESENAKFRIVSRSEGPITEADIKATGNHEEAIIVGFNVKSSPHVRELAERRNITIQTFDIIYKMTEWLKEELEKRRPKIDTEETIGKAKILKTFSKTKERQVIGGKVLEGKIILGKTVKILRKDFEIGRGKIVNLEKNKVKSSDVTEGSEFGTMIESKTEIAPGDVIESFSLTKK